MQTLMLKVYSGETVRYYRIEKDWQGNIIKRELVKEIPIEAEAA